MAPRVPVPRWEDLLALYAYRSQGALALCALFLAGAVVAGARRQGVRLAITFGALIGAYIVVPALGRVSAGVLSTGDFDKNWPKAAEALDPTPLLIIVLLLCVAVAAIEAFFISRHSLLSKTRPN